MATGAAVPFPDWSGDSPSRPAHRAHAHGRMQLHPDAAQERRSTDAIRTAPAL